MIPTDDMEYGEVQEKAKLVKEEFSASLGPPEKKGSLITVLVLVLAVAAAIFMLGVLIQSRTIHNLKKQAIERGYAHYDSDRQFQWREKQDTGAEE